MNTSDINLLVPWIVSHGYFIFLIIAIIEGPIVTVAAGIAAALGYLNIFIIIFLAIAGDVGGDILYYGLGKMLHNFIRSPFFKYIGFTDEKFTKVESLLHKNIWKTVFIVKMSPLIGPVGLVMIGAVKAPFKKFFETALYVGVPKSIFFALVGFYAGQVYIDLSQKLVNKEHTIAGIIIVIGVIYVTYRKVAEIIARRLERK